MLFGIVLGWGIFSNITLGIGLIAADSPKLMSAWITFPVLGLIFGGTLWLLIRATANDEPFSFLKGMLLGILLGCLTTGLCAMGAVAG